MRTEPKPAWYFKGEVLESSLIKQPVSQNPQKRTTLHDYTDLVFKGSNCVSSFGGSDLTPEGLPHVTLSPSRWIREGGMEVFKHSRSKSK